MLLYNIMPQLPKRNTLDFAPDSIISASKKMSVVQSSQMQDAMDTDATLRPVKNTNETKREMGRFLDTIGEWGDTINAIIGIARRMGVNDLNQQIADEFNRQEGAGRAHLARLYGGMDPDPSGKAPRGRPKKKKDIEFDIVEEPQVASSSKPVRTIIDFFERASKGTEEPRHPNASAFAERGESKGQARSSVRSDDFDEMLDEEGGDLDPEDPSDSSSSSASSISSRSSYYGDSDSLGPIEAPAENETLNRPASALIQYILRATRLLRDADRLVSTLRDNKQYLSGGDIEEFKVAYNVLINQWKKLGSGADLGGFNFFDALTEQVEFGGEMLKVLNDERKKLMMDILILVNSYNANESLQPAFDPTRLVQPVKNVLSNYGEPNIATQKGFFPVPEVVGAGRNFYGKTINETKDIPTIWGARQSCPTKYLL
jgi:hypothetical protein